MLCLQRGAAKRATYTLLGHRLPLSVQVWGLYTQHTKHDEILINGK